jgi:catechol 2,3-dioxygenase
MIDDARLLPDSTHLGPVVLRVTNIDHGLPVWRDLVGLTVVARRDGEIDLGVGGRALIVVRATANAAFPAKGRGLFHVAVHVTTRHELARTAARFKASGLRHSAQDHITSESLYISDPDGNGIEVCLDTPGRGRFEMVDGKPRAVGSDGSVHSGLEPLDVTNLLTELGANEAIADPLPADTFIGHIHLRVRDPERLMQFYLDVLGFRPNVRLPSFGMFDVGTQERRHMVAFNTWAGADLVEPPEGAAGLEQFNVYLPSKQALDEALSRLDAAGIVLSKEPLAVLCADPEGNRLRLSASNE